MTEQYFDEDGFEIPKEYWPLATKKECLMSLSLYEFNVWLNKKGFAQEQYRLECIKRHLIDGRMWPDVILHSKFDPETNSIIVDKGYTFNKKTCTIEKVNV